MSGKRDAYGGLTREQKIQRLRQRSMQASTTAANIFSSDVPTRKRRYIVGILLTSADASPVYITISKVLRDNTLEDLLDSYEVDATDNQSVNGSKLVDLDNPICIIQGDQNLEFDVDTATKTLEVTVWWYDDPR